MSEFEKGAIVLCAQKLLADYFRAAQRDCVEPESFFEQWTEKFINPQDPVFATEVWRGFMHLLVERSKRG